MSKRAPGAFRNALTAVRKQVAVVEKALVGLGYGSYRGMGGWSQIIREPFAGAWQRNQEVAVADATRYFPVYACMTLIASDIGKLPWVFKRLVSTSSHTYWETAQNSAYSWINVRPNHYQTPSKFREQWILSKLQQGNTYVLKKRAAGGRVEALYILDPTRVTPLVNPDSGEVFYRIAIDNLSSVKEDIIVPASEIIHDRMNCLFHPLVGIPPLYAAAASVNLGMTGHNNQINFLRNASNPGGILTAPGEIAQEEVDRLKAYFGNYTGESAGHVAVVGSGLKFERLAMSAMDTQLIEHMRWSADSICAVFHVPAYMIIGEAPAAGNIGNLREEYYGQCLQALINSMNECLDDGLELGEKNAIELDVTEFLRADINTRMTYLGNAIKGSVMTVNEARAREDLPPVEGGDTVYMQQQNYSLEALAERDRNSPLLPKPEAPAPATPALPAPDSAAGEQDDEEEALREFMDTIQRGLTVGDHP